MDYSNEQLLKFLSLSNKKLKRLKQNIKNVRIQRNEFKSKLDEIEWYLNNNIREKFDKYDYPSDRECYELQGKKEIKEDILRIISK
ncbi:hypothetical protein [Clostridium sporogenes]|uniref:hypothetical protein n=1 Tax=Clostridium sporogenes TaxID=1509 RepID=UPI0013D36A12|nr:hypothetical protein [Clostridium sporogenes]NFH40777.1 hypothetical protein [Clostridium sporogenes]